MVVFKILLAEIFYHRPQRSQPPLGPIRTLCDVSALALSLNFEDQVRSRHYVQVQSPFSDGLLVIIKTVFWRGHRQKKEREEVYVKEAYVRQVLSYFIFDS